MEVRGLEQLKRKLDALEKKAATRALRKAIRAGNTIVAKAVKAATPVDQGLLKKAQSSKVSVKKGSGFAVIGADTDKLKADAESEKRPSNIDALVEFGHVTPDGTVVPPSGFHRRASAEALPRAEQAMIAKLKTEIEAEATR